MLLAAVPILMTGCKKEAANGTSNVQFKLTDAPGQYDALNIDIKGIQAHSQTSGWVTLNSSLGVVNVMNYVNGNSTLIAQGDFQAGAIDQVKLILGADNSVVVNGATYTLQNSAALQSGLTVNMNNQIQAGGNYIWTIDFDAAQSVTAAGSGNFQLTPVIRLIVDSLSSSGGGTISGGINTGGSGSSGGINIGGSGSVVIGGSTTGSIAGSISPAGLASVCITGSNGSGTCTMTDISGHFMLQAVGAGTYSVTITPVVPTVSAHTISNVNVSAGATTNLGVVAM